MNEDLRCCGNGTCIIDTEGRCWCGQQWDGQKMCHAALASAPHTVGPCVNSFVVVGSAAPLEQSAFTNARLP